MWEIIAVVTSGLSLILSVISLISSLKSQNLQNQLNQLEVKLKTFELAEIEKAENEKSKSCVEARLIRIGIGKHRLKVWNSGNTVVYNVSVNIPDEYGIFLDKDKFPYDVLEPQKGFEVIATIFDGSASKFKLTTIWTDINNIEQQKEQMGDVSY